jgi:hypothetical protein
MWTTPTTFGFNLPVPILRGSTPLPLPRNSQLTSSHCMFLATHPLLHTSQLHLIHSTWPPKLISTGPSGTYLHHCHFLWEVPVSRSFVWASWNRNTFASACQQPSAFGKRHGYPPPSYVVHDVQLTIGQRNHPFVRCAKVPGFLWASEIFASGSFEFSS